ncbi:VOC family protein [Pseudoxanthomonas sp. PXM03]|uniref:VOC family protein n=1 Tax=Pseudoxanthomonas sp. PXM03 TaxID=2769284 RepID=UPI001786463D|nr:VOC family protein [Pseudoxanthomonas sp. PXM03]MBD9436032.1 VOC family protein [Pseudoxanthomonas sp. PXM03]
MHLLINIDVSDLAAAETLYTHAFGLVAARRFGDGGVELLGAQAPIYLLQNAAGSVATTDALRDYTRHWTPVHLDVVVESLEPALDRALQAGLVQETPIRETNWGRIVRLADPWGHGWCLLQFVNRGYDEIAT